MKRSSVIALVLSFGLVVIAFGQVKAKDGIYFAQGSEYAKDSGWKDQVILTVNAGKITKAVWNGVSNSGVADKLTVVAAGGYPMVKAGKAKAEWNVQAKSVEDYLVKTQDLAFSKYSDVEGRTDAISGASIHVKQAPSPRASTRRTDGTSRTRPTSTRPRAGRTPSSSRSSTAA